MIGQHMGMLSLAGVILDDDIDEIVRVFTPIFDSRIRGIAWQIEKGDCEFFFQYRPRQEMDPEVEEAIRDAIQVLEGLGAEILEISLPNTEYALPVYHIIAPAEASSNLARYDGVRFGRRARAKTSEFGSLHGMYAGSRDEGFGEEVKRRIMLGTYALSAGYYDAYYTKAQRVRTLICREYREAFRSVDVILSATTPTPAFRFGERMNDPISMYLSDILTIPCNLVGLPGISQPCGFTSSKLPIGLQIVGKPWGEQAVLRAAMAYEGSTYHHLAIPPL